MDKENKLILYRDEEGRVSVNTRFADEDVWLTQAQLAEIYQTTQQNISLHLQGIYGDKELDDDERTHKKYLLVRQEGKRKVQREIEHYNLDVIIALGYRVQSPIAVRFRRWATQRLHEYIQKGFTMDDERLKQKLKPYGLSGRVIRSIEDVTNSLLNSINEISASSTLVALLAKKLCGAKTFGSLQEMIIFAEKKMDYGTEESDTRAYHAFGEERSVCIW